MLTQILKELNDFSAYVVEKAKKKKKKVSPDDIFEELADAAERKRKCRIVYNKIGEGTKEYTVAPYSLRWHGDNEMLYAYDFATGHIKSFYLEDISQVDVTGKRFVPKWEVELG